MLCTLCYRPDAQVRSDGEWCSNKPPAASHFVGDRVNARYPAIFRLLHCADSLPYVRRVGKVVAKISDEMRWLK